MGNYRFGFNGKQKDDEIKGKGNSLDFGARICDTRLGIFPALDPLASKFPGQSPYVFAANSPIRLVDEDGRFPLSRTDAGRYPRLAQYLQSGIIHVVDNKTIMAGLAEYGRLSATDVKKGLEYSVLSNGQNGASGNPRINITPMLPGIGGEYPPNRPDFVTLNSLYAEAYENAKPGIDKQAAELVVTVIILHEYVHYGDERKGQSDYPGEEGNLFEQSVLGIDALSQNIMGNSVEETLSNAKRILKEHPNILQRETSTGNPQQNKAKTSNNTKSNNDGKIKVLEGGDNGKK